MNTGEIVVKKSIELLIPSKYQPRKHFDNREIRELSESIKNYGIVNPILVRTVGDKFEIIAGERRYRAAKMCGLTEVPVIIKDLDDNQCQELALIENTHREDLTAVETAQAYEEIMKNKNYTQEELSNKIGISQLSIANKLKLLELPEEVQNAVIEKKISERHARCLLDLADNKAKQLEILNRIIEEKLTVKETEDLIELTNTSDEDIEQAIKDIMKSLNIKEDEKESDNMNNGNFFPTYDNNMTQNDNMNNASMNASPQINPQENVMPTFISQQDQVAGPMAPTINPTLDTNTTIQPGPVAPMGVPEPVPMAQAPMMDQPLFNNDMNTPPAPAVPEFQFQAPPVVEPAPETSNFGSLQPGPVAPMGAPEPVSMAQEPMMDQPLFNNDMNTPPAPAVPEFQFQAPPVDEQPIVPPTQPENINETFYEVPVNVSPVIENTGNQDRFSEIENLLSSNGINYKAYSNDNGHCIIIEL